MVKSCCWISAFIQHADLPVISFSSMLSVGWGRCLASGVEKQSRNPLHLVQSFNQHHTSWKVLVCQSHAFQGLYGGQSVSFLPPLCNPCPVSKSFITCHLLFSCQHFVYMSLCPFLSHFLLSLPLRILLPLTSLYCNEVSRGNGSKRGCSIHCGYPIFLQWKKKKYLKEILCKFHSVWEFWRILISPGLVQKPHWEKVSKYCSLATWMNVSVAHSALDSSGSWRILETQKRGGYRRSSELGESSSHIWLQIRITWEVSGITGPWRPFQN